MRHDIWDNTCVQINNATTCGLHCLMCEVFHIRIYRNFGRHIVSVSIPVSRDCLSHEVSDN